MAAHPLASQAPAPSSAPPSYARVTQETGRRLGRTNTLLLRFLPIRPADEDLLRSALITAAVACLFTLIAPCYALLIWLLEQPPGIYYLLALEAFFVATGSLLLLRQGWFRSAAWLLLVGGSVAVIVPFLREGANSLAAGNFVIVVVMAALLLGWRGVLALGIPFAVLVLAVGIAQQGGYFKAEPENASYGVFALMQIISLVVMLVIFDRVRLGILRAQRELEAKLLQAQRLEAVGRLAGGIAHDFNNLLTVILGNVSLLSSSAASQEAAAEVEEIHMASLRAAQLTRQLLAFSRQQKLEPCTFDLSAMLAEEKTMFSRLIPETIRFEMPKIEGPLWIHADPGQISQVMLNLVVNARDAMPEGGRLRITTERSNAGSSATPEQSVILRVADTGVGMDTATRERAFEPFFTTKGATAGTGLGLATVHGIVNQSGGKVRVKSYPGAGTEFEIVLPLTAKPDPQANLKVAAKPDKLAAQRTVLLVEDDASVREATARVLRTLGLEVIECADKSAGVRAWRKRKGHIDVVITDVVMPGGSGPELVRALLRDGPVRVLFTSGYLDTAVHDSVFTRSAFLAKPFTKHELETKLNEVFTQPALELGSLEVV